MYADTCDSAWKGTRDNLIISAFVFSIISALLSLLSAAMVLAFYGRCIYAVRMNVGKIKFVTHRSIYVCMLIA